MKMSENGGEGGRYAGPGHLCERRCGDDSLFGVLRTQRSGKGDGATKVEESGGAYWSPRELGLCLIGSEESTWGVKEENDMIKCVCTEGSLGSSAGGGCFLSWDDPLSSPSGWTIHI